MSDTSESLEEKKYPAKQAATFAGGMAVTMGLVDVLAHLGPTGLLVGGIASYVAWRHGPELYEQVRELLPFPAQAGQSEPTAKFPQRSGRSLLDRALGRFPETLPESEQQDEVQQDDHSADVKDQAQNEATDDATLVSVAKDPRLALSLAPYLRPDVNIVLREGIFGCGCKGSGKTGVLAKIIEQITLIAKELDPTRRGIPGVVLDKEGDLLPLMETLPNGRVADQEHWYSAADIIENRLQVIVNLQAWIKDEDRAAVMIHLINDLIHYTSSLEQHKRLPCPVFLDEAQYWLPQESVSYLTRETQRQLIDAFNILLSTGRKRGLTPFIFTQRIAQIDKSTISLGIQIFMRQVIDNDQKRCMDYIRSDVIGDKKNLAQLSEGQGIVCLPGGVQLVIQFDERESTHLSHAPTVDRVLARPTQAAPARSSYAQPAQPYQPPASSASQSVRPEQISWQPGPGASPYQSGAAPGTPRAFAREADKTQHFTKELGPELQAACDTYRPGMHHHTLARYLGTTPSVAGQLLRQLQKRGLIDAVGNKTMVSPQENQEELQEYDRAVTVWHELEVKKCANVRDFAAAMKMGETKAWDLLSKMDRLGLIHWERRKKKEVV